MFIGLEKLETLYLTKTKLRIIGAKTFKHLLGLINLDLNENQITTIESFAFLQQKNLVNL